MKFGRFQIVEPQENMTLFHRHDGVTTLATSDFEPLNGVLDQEDLVAQGIDVSTFIPGAPADVAELGSCTANATMSAASRLGDSTAYASLVAAIFAVVASQPGGGPFGGYDDVKTIEEAAISFYHGCTDQTGDPSEEWPPTDCGSSGPYIVEYLQALKLISGQKIAATMQDLCSLLQTGPVLQGTPFFNAWMEPTNGFVDGNGTQADIEAAIKSGVAGGHETCISGIQAIALSETGVIVPEKTIFKVRNSWTKSWGDNGSFYIHASTLSAISKYCDFRQLIA